MNPTQAAGTGVERASTLESKYYIDPAVLPRERERIFCRMWQCVGYAEQVAAAGHYFNLRSRSYSRGRYSVKQERSLFHFHQLYRAAMEQT